MNAFSVSAVVLSFVAALPCTVLSQHYHGTGQEEHKPAKNSPSDDPGHNAHQETLIFACLGAVVIMAILMVVLLWFFVDRTRQTVSIIERMLPQIIERMKSDDREELHGTTPGHLSGTCDANNEFESGFKGSVDFIDATGDRVKLTSYSKKEDTITTVVDGTGGATGLTSYTKKAGNGEVKRHLHHEVATEPLPAYTSMDHHQVRTVVDMDGPMSARQQQQNQTASTGTGHHAKHDVQVVAATVQPVKSGLSGGRYVAPSSSSPHFNAYSPDHISGHPNSRVVISRHNNNGHKRLHRPKLSQSSSPPTSPKDPEKAALARNGDVILPYWEPPAYTAYDNRALSIDKRATLPVTDAVAPGAGSKPEEKDHESDEVFETKRKRRSSFYVESHV